MSATLSLPAPTATATATPPGSTSDPAKPARAPQVVILGGGYAGALLAHALEPDAKRGLIRTVVVERRDAVHHKIGAIRAAVRAGEHAERCRVPLERVVRSGRVLVGDVVKVHPSTRELEMATGDRVPYDVLVCCTGTANHSAGDLPLQVKDKDAVRAYFKDISAAIARAQRVLVVGGGPTAVEFAGEIRDAYPTKAVTMVCSSAGLLSSCVAQPSSNFMKLLYAKLERHSIELVRGDKVVYPTPADFSNGRKYIEGPITVKTSAGVEREFDLVLWAATWAVNSDVFPEDWLNSMGELAVQPSFLLDEAGENCGRHFAFGDVASLCETKQAITLPRKVPVVRANVLAVAAAVRTGEDPANLAPKLKSYQVMDKPVLYLPIGAHDGVSQVHSLVAPVRGGSYTAKAKGKDLYTSEFWGLLAGQPPPPATQ